MRLPFDMHDRYGLLNFVDIAYKYDIVSQCEACLTFEPEV